MSGPVVLVDYDPRWPAVFLELGNHLRSCLGDLDAIIEHIGSTAVPGIAAKPIIDIDVAVAVEADIAIAIKRIETLGYVHEGNLGIPGREAMQAPQASPPHHLYVCSQRGREFRRHLAFRDQLRCHPETAQSYVAVKKTAATQFRDNRTEYTNAKSEFIERVLRNV